MPSLKVVLAIALGVAGIAIWRVLAERPLAVLSTNAVAPSTELVTFSHGRLNACQSNESLPRGTVAVRLWLEAFVGPSVSVRAYAAGRLVTAGERGSGWGVTSVTVPVTPVSRAVHGATVCFSSGAIAEPLTVEGTRAKGKHAAYEPGGQRLPGRMPIQYLGRGSASWLGLAGTVTERMGLGRAWAGDWIAYLAIALMLCATVFVSRSLLRELDE